MPLLSRDYIERGDFKVMLQSLTLRFFFLAEDTRICRVKLICLQNIPLHIFSVAIAGQRLLFLI